MKINLLTDCYKSVFSVRPCLHNTPFPSSKKSHFQNEARCETFVVKMSFICIIIKTHFHVNGFALSLALKVRFFGTRKWPIPLWPLSQESDFLCFFRFVLFFVVVLLAFALKTVNNQTLNDLDSCYWIVV